MRQRTPLFAVGEALLVGLFVSLTRVYGGFAVRSYGRFVKWNAYHGLDA